MLAPLVVRDRSSSSGRARPRSVILTWPRRLIMMLVGFTSRWITLRSMGVGQAAGGGEGDVQGVADGQAAAPPLQQGRQREAVDELHGEVGIGPFPAPRHRTPRCSGGADGSARRPHGRSAARSPAGRPGLWTAPSGRWGGQRSAAARGKRRPSPRSRASSRSRSRRERGGPRSGRVRTASAEGRNYLGGGRTSGRDAGRFRGGRQSVSRPAAGGRTGGDRRRTTPGRPAAVQSGMPFRQSISVGSSMPCAASCRSWTQENGPILS